MARSRTGSQMNQSPDDLLLSLFLVKLPDLQGLPPPFGLYHKYKSHFSAMFMLG